MEFGKLNVVTQNFLRKVNNPRGQDYEGIKFRRYISNNKGMEGKTQETFTVSDKLFETLNLKEYALAQANTPDSVLLLLLEEKEGAQPEAKFMTQSVKKDGTKQNKTKSFSNIFLVDALVERKILDGKEMENQYLALQDVTSDFTDRPDHVKGVFKIVKDDEVEEGEDEEESETVGATATQGVGKDEF